MATLKVLPSTSREASYEAALRYDIYALSTILANHRGGTSQRPPAREDKQLAFWRDLAFLLSTTSTGRKSREAQSRKARNTVVAVTGNLEITADSYTIAATVVANDNHCLLSNGEDEATLSEVEAPRIRIVRMDVKGDTAKVEELLTDPKTDIELEDHVRDVFTLLIYCMTLSTKKRPVMTMHFAIFILLRTYRNLVGRLRVGQKTWGANPIRIIHRRWSSTTLPPESSQLNESILITQPDVRETLGDLNVPPGSKENTFLLNAHTAGKWAQVLLDALETLETQTGLSAIVGVGDENDKYRSFQAPLDDRAGLIHAFVVLEQFVSSKALAHLLTASVAKEIHDKREAIQTGEDKPHAKTQSSGESDSTDPTTLESDDSDNEDMFDEDYAASITSEDTEDVAFDYLKNTHSIPVIRYVSSLAIYLSASRAIFRHLFKSLTVVAEVSVSMVTLAGTQRIHVDPNWIDDTQKRHMKTLLLNNTQAERLRTLLNDKLEHRPLATVHAEAALMAAAVEVAEGKLDCEALQATPANGQKIRIGVSKKCCFCCAKLGEELKWLRDASGSIRYGPQFVLPGQHGVIFPWYPPPGLPVAVLRYMAERLEEALDTYLVAELGADREDDIIIFDIKHLEKKLTWT